MPRRLTATTPTKPCGAASALFFAGLLLLLQGCSLLPERRATQAGAATEAQPDDATPTAAFALHVEAPEPERNYLLQHLELQRFRDIPELQASELTRLVEAADANARELLGTLGYFQPQLQWQMQQVQQGQQGQDGPQDASEPVRITLQAEPGPQTQVTSADIGFVGASANDPGGSALRNQIHAQWSLATGEPFTQSAWDAAKNQGLQTLQARRYPAAQISESLADIDADRSEAALRVRYDPGPAYRFGPLRLQGTQRYDAEGLRRLALLPEGAEYSQAKLLDAQQRLAASGYFDSVFLTLDTDGSAPQSAEAVAPVIAQVREALLQKWVFGIGVSTDSGLRLGTDHIHNRLPWLGWRAVSKIAIDRNTKGLESEWTALPDQHGWRWFTGARLQREDTGSYWVNSVRLRAGRNQAGERINRNTFIQYDQAAQQGLDAPPTSNSISANIGWTGRFFDSPLVPTAGHGLALELGAGTTLRPQRAPFVRALMRGLTFVPLNAADSGSGRLALRGEVGALAARDGADIPATQLFLTGGDTTVRGYGLREIGSRTANNQVFGGRYMAVASVEWQRPITVRGERSAWESTLFIDAGAVGDQPSAMRPRVGVGTGVRWRSPVGPLQADLAWGVQSHALRLHLRLGFVF